MAAEIWEAPLKVEQVKAVGQRAASPGALHHQHPAAGRGQSPRHLRPPAPCGSPRTCTKASRWAARPRRPHHLHAYRLHPGRRERRRPRRAEVHRRPVRARATCPRSRAPMPVPPRARRKGTRRSAPPRPPAPRSRSADALGRATRCASTGSSGTASWPARWPTMRLRITTVDVSAGPLPPARPRRARGSSPASPSSTRPGRWRRVVPGARRGQWLDLLGLSAQQKFTEPPARYSEASLVRALEQKGIGRPSTYAAIIGTIQDRGYVYLEQKHFYPTDLGFAVTDQLVAHFPDVINVEFTADMESKLDQIEEGQADWVATLQDFYTPFNESLVKAEEAMQDVSASSRRRPTSKCASCATRPCCCESASAAPSWPARATRSASIPAPCPALPTGRRPTQALPPSPPIRCATSAAAPWSSAPASGAASWPAPAIRSARTPSPLPEEEAADRRPRREREVRPLRRAHGRPPRPLRPLPGLHRLPRVQGHQEAPEGQVRFRRRHPARSDPRAIRTVCGRRLLNR